MRNTSEENKPLFITSVFLTLREPDCFGWWNTNSLKTEREINQGHSAISSRYVHMHLEYSKCETIKYIQSKLYNAAYFAWLLIQNSDYTVLSAYIYAFSRRFYPKRLTMHSGYTCFITMCVPWESNPQPSALLTQCSTTEPQEHNFREAELKMHINLWMSQYFSFALLRWWSCSPELLRRTIWLSYDQCHKFTIWLVTYSRSYFLKHFLFILHQHSFVLNNSNV